jgi:hypothetical protein
MSVTIGRERNSVNALRRAQKFDASHSAGPQHEAIGDVIIRSQNRDVEHRF